MITSYCVGADGRLSETHFICFGSRFLKLKHSHIIIFPANIYSFLTLQSFFVLLILLP
jgi:hypothetical protein